MSKSLIILAGAAALLLAGAALAADDDVPGPQGKLQGEVVAVRQQTRLQDEGAVVEIRLRTRDREEHWLQLGPAARYGDAVQVGDRVRLRAMAGAAGEPSMIQAMHNYRTGERLQVRNGDGTMAQTRDRFRDGTGTGSQARERHRSRHEGEQGTQGAGGGRPAGGGGGRGGHR